MKEVQESVSSKFGSSQVPRVPESWWSPWKQGHSAQSSLTPPPKMGKGTAKMNLLLVDQKLLEAEDKVLFLLCPLHCVIPGRCVISVLAKLNGWDGS